jgi:GNAT superfamily N-acetyltransferase
MARIFSGSADGLGLMAGQAAAGSYLLMQRNLRDIAEEPRWPDGIHLHPFAAGIAPEVHALMELAYRDGGGRVTDLETWWSALSQDVEYELGLCFPVRDGTGKLIAFAQCWTSGFVKDFVVHPHHRRQGLGRALLLHVFRIFRERGHPAVSLKVETNNPAGIGFYESLGMSVTSQDCTRLLRRSRVFVPPLHETQRRGFVAAFGGAVQNQQGRGHALQPARVGGIGVKHLPCLIFVKRAET